MASSATIDAMNFVARVLNCINQFCPALFPCLTLLKYVFFFHLQQEKTEYFIIHPEIDEIFLECAL